MADHETEPDDLVERLEDSKGWPNLGRAAAARIEALEAENARLREAMEPFVALAKDRAVDAAEWRGKDSIHAIMRVDDLRRVLSALISADAAF